ncbi:MAG: YlbF family regulator [Bacilli bacterium]|nr:YlbF family regulator [Bacilli bacterium]
MEIYDTANRLAEEIRNSEQYKLLKKSKEELFNNPEKKKLIEEFEELKREVQILEVKRENNQEIDEEDKKVKLAKLYNVLIENKDIKEYFDYEIAFNKLMFDVNKIIGDSIKDII